MCEQSDRAGNGSGKYAMPIAGPAQYGVQMSKWTAPGPKTGKVNRRDRLGGLLQFYYREPG